MTDSNHRVREACMICEGTGKAGPELCHYCQGHGQVFARTGAPERVMLATGDCKQPMRLQALEGQAITISRRNT